MMRYAAVFATFVVIVWAAVSYHHTAVTPVEVSDEIDGTINQQTLATERVRIDRDLAEHDPATAYQLFIERYQDQSPFVQHEFAHVFGQALYEHAGVPGVAVCDATFSFGCYHSFFGFALLEHGLDIIHELEAACIEVHGEKGLGCQHGIGHGVLAEVGTDQLDKALDACQELKWKGPLGGCKSGVFMEYNFNVMQGASEVRKPTEGYFHPCTEVAEHYQEACYFDLPSWWYSLERSASNSPMFQPPYGELAERCDQSGSTINQRACFRGLGNIIASPNTFTLDEIKDFCALAPKKEGNSFCLQGAAWLISNSPTYERDWEALCSEEVGDARATCLSSKKMI